MGQVKPWKVVEGNEKEDQTITPVTNEIIHSRKTSSKGTKDGERSCRDRIKRGTETSSRDHHKD